MTSIPIHTPTVARPSFPSQLPTLSSNGRAATPAATALDSMTRGSMIPGLAPAAQNTGLALAGGGGDGLAVSQQLASQGAAILSQFAASPELDTAGLKQSWNAFSSQAQQSNDVSNADLVDAALLQSYQDTADEVQNIALNQLKYLNAKKELREQLSELQEIRADNSTANPEDPIAYPFYLTDTSGAFTAEGALPVTPLEVEAGALSAVTDDGQSVPPGTKAGLDSAIDRVEQDMASFGDMSEMEMLQMQEAMFKKQQKFGMMSAVLKSEHDTAMGIIRNLA